MKTRRNFRNKSAKSRCRKHRYIKRGGWGTNTPKENKQGHSLSLFGLYTLRTKERNAYNERKKKRNVAIASRNAISLAHEAKLAQNAREKEDIERETSHHPIYRDKPEEFQRKVDIIISRIAKNKGQTEEVIRKIYENDLNVNGPKAAFDNINLETNQMFHYNFSNGVHSPDWPDWFKKMRIKERAIEKEMRERKKIDNVDVLPPYEPQSSR